MVEEIDHFERITKDKGRPHLLCYVFRIALVAVLRLVFILSISDLELNCTSNFYVWLTLLVICHCAFYRHAILKLAKNRIGYKHSGI